MLLAAGPAVQAEDQPIRLRPATSVDESGPTAPERDPLSVVGGPRRGFDYDAFEARLESLWFQRKALLTEGREADAQ
jgi:hypothetical protein